MGIFINVHAVESTFVFDNLKGGHKKSRAHEKGDHPDQNFL